jgi:membrane protein
MRLRGGAEFTLKELALSLYEKVTETDIFSHAAQVAFFFSFAIFPFLYFVISLFGLVLESSDALKAELFGYLRRVMPWSVFDLVSRTIEEIIQNSSSGKLTIGLVVTLWSASAGFDAIRAALNTINNLKETRIWFRTKAESLLLTFIISILVGLVLAIVFYGWQIFETGLKKIGVQSDWPLLLKSIQWISIFFVMLLVCEVIYAFLPNFKKIKWHWITPGSVAAILMWVVLSAGFRTYLGYFNSYDRTYGSLGTMIIMMLWLYLTASALMIGGALNAVLDALIEGRKPYPAPSE